MAKNPKDPQAQHPSPTDERVPLTSDQLLEGRRPDQLGTHGGPAHAGAKDRAKPAGAEEGKKPGAGEQDE